MRKASPPSVRPPGRLRGRNSGFWRRVTSSPWLSIINCWNRWRNKRLAGLLACERESWRHEGLEKSLLEPVLGGQASKIPSPPQQQQRRRRHHSSSSLYYSCCAPRTTPLWPRARASAASTAPLAPSVPAPRAPSVQLTRGGRCVRWDAVAATVVAMLSA